ncbi:hypothetical protein KR009_011682 [Drosophila setifemur]|nr:hypothetical protein KR009_011682 [Drosophila setifemur]
MEQNFNSHKNLLVGEDSSDGTIYPDAIANDLIGDILIKHTKQGHHAEANSKSNCSLSLSLEKSTSKVDHRLEYWKSMINQRRALHGKLRRETGRASEQILMLRQLKAEYDIEVVGQARRADTEFLGNEEGKKDLDAILGILPSITDLDQAHDAKADATISSSSIEPSKIVIGQTLSVSKGTIMDLSHQTHHLPIPKCGDGCSGLCVRINGVHYRPKVPEFSPIVERTFSCNPFQRHLRMIVRIENSGRTVLRFCWLQANFFSNNETLLTANPGDFVFDVHPFQLSPGEFRDVTVLYQPRSVSIVKQRWVLVTRPRIFLRRPCGLCLNMHGRCTAPREYLDRLAMERIPSQQLRPKQIGHEPEQEIFLCPYSRQLEDFEAFNIRNRNFKCRTDEDLGQLQALFKRVSPQPYTWDFSVHMLIHLVCDVMNMSERTQFFSELTELIERLRGSSEMSNTPEHLKERCHAGMIYVRGALNGILDEWEKRVFHLEQRVCNPNAVQEEENELGGVLKKRRAPKYLLDSIHMFLHFLIGNAVEDIASVIESLERS